MMKKHEKQAYLEAIRKRYRKAKRCDKSKILDEFCAVCGYHRKYALRRLNEPKKQATRKKPGKPSRYDCAEVMVPLRAIWLATDQMASKRLKVAIPLWLPHYEAMRGEMANEARHKFLAMSSATIDRLLAPVRAQTGKRGLSGTKPGTLLKNQIPLQGCHWDISQPGFIEADTVAHCGTSLAGDFVWSPTMKLFEKKRVGAKIIKKYTKPETPVQRLLAHPAINSQQKKSLKNIYNNFNPFVLRSTIQKKLNAIFKLVR